MDALPRERYPLDEGLSSQEESMKIPPSIDDQDLRSLVDDEVVLVIEEEEGKVGDDNTVTTKAPLYWRKTKVFSQLCVAFAYLAKEGALGEASTAQRISHEFKREVKNFLKGALLSPTQLSTLRKEESEVCDGIDMGTHGNSISLGKPMVSSFTKDISEHDKRMLTLFHAWEKLRKYWKTRNF